LCKDLLHSNPKSIPGLLIEAWILAELERNEEAILCLDQLLNIREDLEEVWNLKGILHMKEGNFEASLPCFDRSLEIAGDYWQAWNNKAVALHNLEKFKEAILCYENAIQADRNHPHSWSNEGCTLYAMGKYNEALKCFEQALALRENAETWNNIGLSHEKKGDLRSALRSFGKALSLNSDFLEATKNRKRIENLIRSSKSETVEMIDFLMKIPGIGKSKAKALIKTFPSLNSLKESSEEKIASVKGISERMATRIKEVLREEG